MTSPVESGRRSRDLPVGASGAPRPPLRLLLVTNGGTIPHWLCRCLDDMKRSGSAEVVLVLEAARAAKRRPDSVLYRLHAHFDRLLFRRLPDALAPVSAHTALPHCPIIPQAQLRNRPLDDVPIDVVVDPFALLGPDCEAVRPQYGTWTTTFGRSGDPKTQSTPGYWEVVEGVPETETRLCIRQGGIARMLAIYVSVAPTDRRSVSRSQNHVYWKLAAALASKLHALWKDPATFVRGLDAAMPFDAVRLPASAPANRAVVRACTGLVRRYIADKWRHARYRDQWALAYQMDGGIPGRSGTPRTLLPPPDRAWADPFPVRVGNEYYVFHEDWELPAGKGSLVVTVLDEKGNPLAQCLPVLEEAHHLSYPFVFPWDGNFFMVPESAAGNRVQLYRCVRFPDRWKRERVLLSEVRAFDPTPAYLCGRWWLFANVAPYGAGSMDELQVFHADSPLGPWVPHGKNPVNSDVRSARPAGRIFERDGQIYRPAQDCSKHYGYAVSINRIARLDPEAYEEVEVDKILPSWGPEVTGVHTFNSAGELTVIDCVIRRRRSRRGF